MTLLSVQNLHTQFETDTGIVKAVDGVSFDVDAGETVCIVGESGSGKSVTSESITRLFPSPPGEIVEGTINFDGQDITTLSEKQLQSIRGDQLGYIFQNPQSALNPVYSIGTQIEETFKLHRDLNSEERRKRTVQLLNRVGIPEATKRIDDYPHEFSGGMKQRVVIAMALACQPDLLIADEPTTALDVTIQSQILELLQDLQDDFGMSILLITHDLGVVAQIADKVVVMYAGKVMERGSVEEIFDDPAHPYTRALLKCLPGLDEEIEPIEGSLPSPINPPDGCRFHTRCPVAREDCMQDDQPPLKDVGEDHYASCVYYQEGYDEETIHEKMPSPQEGKRKGESPHSNGVLEQ